MKSIRTYLLLALLATITVVSFLSVIQGYRSSIEKVNVLFDRRLSDLAEIIVHANHDIAPREVRAFDVQPDVFFQIWSHDLTLLAYSENAPHQLLFNPQQHDDFNDVNFNQFRWRTFSLKDKVLNRWVITGERIDLRYGLADAIVSAGIKPTVLAIPIAALIIWVAIGFGLRPLKKLTEQLGNKKADDLAPVVLDKTPVELTQLITTTNDLLARLKNAFLREQQFTSDAAHELRTPISALKVQLFNLKQDKHLSDDELRPLSDGIMRMGHVIEQILSLYKNAPDRAEMNQEKVNLYAVAQQVIAQGYHQLEAKNQHVSLDGEENCFVIADQFALETLMQNLLNNATKYSPRESQIELSIYSDNQDAFLSIEDSGAGILGKDYARVFERFYRVDGDRHQTGEAGCGLGLAIVKHIVDMHGADITLGRSDKLGGLKVTIKFKGAE
ncbi:MAG: sensor histidine kinase N-terminal domain-containing protein [Cycloclasticus sp.]|nr:sensor histidine kinase N-terminal domain-containing protein [Cycloclasticus sp.]